MTERIPCQSQDCAATILPATAHKTGGFCMPCYQAQERRKRQAYIEQHRRDVDLYKGIADPVEVLKIMHTKQAYDPLIRYLPYPLNREQVYSALSGGDAQRMKAYALDLLSAGDEETSVDILLSLLCYNNVRLTDCIPALIGHELYYPGILYKDASAEVRDQLLEQVEQDNENRNHLLLALAWIGDGRIVQQFQQWREQPPQWAKELFVSPDQYSLEAGWKLTEAGVRRDLFSHTGFAIERAAEPLNADLAANEPARFLGAGPEECPWCGSGFTRLMELRNNHPSVRDLALADEWLKVDTCLSCGSYSVIYMETGVQEEPRWSIYNQAPQPLPDLNLGDDNDEYLAAAPRLHLAAQPRNAYHAVEWTLEPAASQVGGHPTWIQDAEYPACPCCSENMIFIAQLDWSQLGPYGEGIYYMFICPKDKITATVYQQS
ncbi:DUF1963 domain-containing protein [Paenibacillus sp. IHBB 3054]|uniref:DUF1963 domain-containing protein n=1 Tax=Paenibacillus sp. IHBB 3054 TaxID=3425689 RepID=UPI003F66A3ED